jgi:hypothetical protein
MRYGTTRCMVVTHEPAWQPNPVLRPLEPYDRAHLLGGEITGDRAKQMYGALAAPSSAQHMLTNRRESCMSPYW